MMRFAIFMMVAILASQPCSAQSNVAVKSGLSADQLDDLSAQIGRKLKYRGQLTNIRSGTDGKKSLMVCGNLGTRPFSAILNKGSGTWKISSSDKSVRVFAIHSACSKRSLALPDFLNFISPNSFDSKGGNYKLTAEQKKLVMAGVSKKLRIKVTSLRGERGYINKKKAVAVCGFASTSRGPIRFNGFLIADKSYMVADVGIDHYEMYAINENCRSNFGITLAGSLP